MECQGGALICGPPTSTPTSRRVHINLVYANASCSITNQHGEIFQLVRGEPWDAEDPLVTQRPTFFSKNPVQARTSVRGGGIVEVVEQATRAPGEKRNMA